MKKYVKEYKGHKVPYGATHFSFESKNEHAAFWGANCMWVVFGGNAKEYKADLIPKDAIELPEAPQEWNGEGLPPVGVECEYESIGHHNGFEWCIFQGFMSDMSYIIEYHHHTSPAMTTCCPFDPNLTTFRPLKTQQEKDREAFNSSVFKELYKIEEILDIVGDRKLKENSIAKVLFNAGFTAPKAEK